MIAEWHTYNTWAYHAHICAVPRSLSLFPCSSLAYSHMYTHIKYKQRKHLAPYLFNDTIRTLLRRLCTSLSHHKSTLAWHLQDSTAQSSTLLKYKSGITICFVLCTEELFALQDWALKQVAQINKMTKFVKLLQLVKISKFYLKSSTFCIRYSQLLVHYFMHIVS